jgi:hypothetical protein
MDTPNIIDQLTEQRDRIIAAIEALNGGRSRRIAVTTGKPLGRPRGKMSAAGKRSISLAMKARWAKAKKSGKNAL